MPGESSAAHREFAREVVVRLREKGFEAFWAGGCVRDELLGLQPKDYDVATSARPDEVRNLFGRRQTIAVGAAFGVVAVLGGRRRGQIEVATFRSDSQYSDGRHPDHVTFSTASEDAWRRDFTINGLFFDPLTSEVIDFVGGRQDLEDGIVRAIGDARQRFSEDRLRLLRAVRFAACFDFRLEAATAAAIAAMAAHVQAVSAERIGMELRRMLLDPHRLRAVSLLRETGLLQAVLPEVATLADPEWEETTRVVAALQEPRVTQVMAALLHRAIACDEVASIGRRLRFSNREIEEIAWLLAGLPVVRQAEAQPWSQLQPWLGHPEAAALVGLLEAIDGAESGAARRCREALALPAAQRNPPPLIDGAALIAHGLQPGPRFSAILRTVREAQLDGAITTPGEALTLVDRLTDEAQLD